jgi:hypothetical protein
MPRDNPGCPIEPRRPRCANPLCTDAATHFPVILFGPTDEIQPDPLPYRLEVPKGMCSACQPGFEPERFFTTAAQAGINLMLEREGRAEADYSRLRVEWVGVDDPSIADIVGGGQARLWF